MKVNYQEFNFTLSVKEVSTWMAALRLAAKSSTVQIIPWDSCPFLIQHGELTRLTGYSLKEDEELFTFLEQKMHNPAPVKIPNPVAEEDLFF